MALANVSLTDTYDLWRVRTNQIVTYLNALDAANVFTIISNSAPLGVTGSSFRLGTIYLTVTPSANILDISTTNVAAPSIVNTAHQLARAGFAIANSGYNLANSAYLASNTVLLTAQGAFAAANAAAVPGSVAAAFNQANAAFAKANVAASNTVAGIAEIATGSEYITGTDTTRVLGVSDTINAYAERGLTDGATINVDLTSFINANLTIQGNRTLGNPSAVINSRGGYIRITQDATGNRTLAYSTSWKFAGQVAPSLSTAPGAIDMLYYNTINVNFIHASLVKDVR